ncbi:MAG: hypothetical protein IKU61_06075 [Clostridia bacterium]|nr:hypothetical protein [Clostridia bacterium]
MKKLTVRDIAVFAMLGALMFAGKKIMEFLPNVHPLAVLTMVYTIAYRRRGIFPIIVYLLLETAFGGFLWTVPYYYIFPLCHAATLLVPADASKWKRQICYTAICTFFGIAFGCLYAPWQAIMWGLSFEKTLAWIAAGAYFDIIHGIGNFALSFAIIPLAGALVQISNCASKKR